MIEDSLFVLLISLSSAAVAEGLSYILIYRTDDYKKLKKVTDFLTRKLDKKKESVPTIDRQKQKDKKVAQLDEQLKNLNRDMSMVKMKSIFFVSLTLLLVFSILNNLFDGRAVAKLPFTPFPMIRGLTHRNLPGQDYTDCSMVFLFLVCSFSIRSNIQRFFGFTPPKNNSWNQSGASSSW